MYYYNRNLGSIVKDDNMLPVDREQYLAKRSEYEDQLEKDYGYLTFNELTNEVEFKAHNFYAIVDTNGSFYITKFRPTDENTVFMEMTLETKLEIEENTNKGYIYYITNGVISRVYVGDNIFDWATKKVVNRVEDSVRSKIFEFNSKDIYGELAKLRGPLILLNGFKNLYIPRDEENFDIKLQLIILSLLSGIRKDTSRLQLYTLDGDTLISTELSGDNLNMDNIRRIISQMDYYYNNIQRIINNYKSDLFKLSYVTDRDEIYHRCDHYMDIIYDKLKQELERGEL